MVTRRRLTVLALCGGLAAALAGPAGARPNPAAYPETVTTPRFAVHFTGELIQPPNPDRITFQMAGELAANAERAYATMVTEWGYPAPLNDGDGRIDIWVQDSTTEALGLAVPDAAGNTATGWITLDPSAATSQAVMAHELLHLIQFGQWIPADGWLLEGSAEWAGFTVSNFSPSGGAALPDTVGAPDMSLDCDSDACGNDLYEIGGYSRWTFFQYLSERYGTSLFKDVLARGATLADPLQTGTTLLDGTLATKGTSLSSAYDEYILRHIVGDYQPAALKGTPPVTYSTTPTGMVSGSLPVQRVAVNHLATRFLKFTRGGSSEGPCYTASLSLTVSLPAGLGAKPVFYSKTLGSSPIGLSVNGNTASATVPWDTCTAGSPGYLSLPNASLTTDAQMFTISGSLVVDTSTVATAIGPPLTTYAGPAAVTSTTGIAPAIRLYGAQLLRVSAADRLVRLIVFASGDGKLQASFGGKVLGTYTLRAGNNDIRFRLPADAVKSLRSVSATRAAQSLLTLTSLSTAGTKGASLTRKVVISKPTRR